MNAPLQVDETIQLLSEERPVPVSYRTGRAGTGKSYGLTQQVQADPSSGILTATTGIASINLNSITINSLLKFYDFNSLRDAYISGNLTRALHKLTKQYRALMIDEASMLQGEALDILYRALREANMYRDVKVPMGITLCGDVGQLPPIDGKWIFQAACWPEFAANTVKLTHVWRQDAGPFLDALNHARVGEGGACAEILSAAGVRWNTARIVEFDGTTIVAKRDAVARHNAEMLRSLPGEPFIVESRRWGKQQPEWGENKRHEWGIPPKIELKIGALVMILANTSDFSMVNGDQGHVLAYDPDSRQMTINLIRTKKDITLAPSCREVSQAELPDDWHGTHEVPAGEDDGKYIPHQHYRKKAKRYVQGQVERFPIQLSYCSTVHRSQGLTLDVVQVDLRDRFFQESAMAYVAMSRSRTLEGLRIVCGKDYFVRQVNVDRRVLPWI